MSIPVEYTETTKQIQTPSVEEVRERLEQSIVLQYLASLSGRLISPEEARKEARRLMGKSS